MHVRGDHGRGCRPQVARIPEAIIFPFNIPTISGFGASAGFNFLLQDRSGSLSVEQLGELSRAVPGGGAQAAGDRQHLHLVRPALPAGQGRARPREGAQARRAGQRGLPGAGRRAGRQLRERLQPLRAPVPRLRPGGGRLPPQARGHRQDLRPQQDHGRHDPARHARHHHVAGGHGAHQPLQPAALGRDQRRARRAATPPARRSPRSRTSFKETMPPEMGFAYSSLSYQEKIAPPAGPDLRGRDRVRLPAARRHVRELAAALGGAARLAARRARRLLRRLARWATTTTSTSRSATSC